MRMAPPPINATLSVTMPPISAPVKGSPAGSEAASTLVNDSPRTDALAVGEAAAVVDVAGSLGSPGSFVNVIPPTVAPKDSSGAGDVVVVVGRTVGQSDGGLGLSQPVQAGTATFELLASAGAKLSTGAAMPAPISALAKATRRLCFMLGAPQKVAVVTTPATLLTIAVKTLPQVPLAAPPNGLKEPLVTESFPSRYKRSRFARVAGLPDVN